MPSNCATRGLVWILGRISSLTGWSGPGTAAHCSGRVTIPWEDLKTVWMWHLGPWFSGGLGSAEGQLDLMTSEDFSKPNNPVVL